MTQNNSTDVPLANEDDKVLTFGMQDGEDISSMELPSPGHVPLPSPHHPPHQSTNKKSATKALFSQSKPSKPMDLLEELEDTHDGGPYHPAIDHEVYLKLQLSPGSSIGSIQDDLPAARNKDANLFCPVVSCKRKDGYKSKAWLENHIRDKHPGHVPITPPANRKSCLPCNKPDTPFPKKTGPCEYQVKAMQPPTSDFPASGTESFLRTALEVAELQQSSNFTSSLLEDTVVSNKEWENDAHL